LVGNERIIWLREPPGAGKSAISTTKFNGRLLKVCFAHICTLDVFPLNNNFKVM
jgi:hypothetical protein